MSKVPLTTTLAVRDTCLCLHVQKAARVLARRFDEALRPLSLTHGQFSMLNALNRPSPATLLSVASLLGMDRTTLTAALKPLVRRDLARVVQSADDRRARLVELTPMGHRVLARAVPIWRSTHAKVEAGLPAAEPARLRRGLRSLVAA